jgi:hypothetical protein
MVGRFCTHPGMPALVAISSENVIGILSEVVARLLEAACLTRDEIIAP